MRVTVAPSPHSYPSPVAAADAPRRLPWAAPFVLLLVVLVASWHTVGIGPELLGRSAVQSLAALLADAYPAELSPPFLGTVLSAMLQTLAMAISSIMLAVALALPLAMVATPLFWHASPADERDLGWRATSTIAFLRGLLSIVRAVPDLLWAMIFVAAAGLGSTPGVLALATTYTAVLGRMYADVFDGVDARPTQALRASGASRLQACLWGIWPQAVPGILAYTLYSFECTVRAASVLGFVGAGGLGQELALSLRLLRYDEALTLLGAFGVLTLGTDYFSGLVRWFMRTPPPAAACTLPRATRFRVKPALALPSAVVGLVLAGTATNLLVGADIGSALFGVFDASRRAMAFVGSWMPPEVEWSFLASLGQPLAETLGMSILGTAGGLCLATVLAIPATSTLVFRPHGSAGRESSLAHGARLLLYSGARLLLGLLRVIPDIVWAAICAIVIGFGPAAGTLAIALHTGGVLGRLCADTLEEAPPAPAQLLRAAGAGSAHLLIWSLYPAVKPLLASYTMLRWESNLRACTILGLVGGGGLGQAIYHSVQLGLYPRALTLVIVVALLVVTVDRMSERLRVRVLRA
jgi:phosphonate transport system permease protein